MEESLLATFPITANPIPCPLQTACLCTILPLAFPAPTRNAHLQGACNQLAPVLVPIHPLKTKGHSALPLLVWTKKPATIYSSTTSQKGAGLIPYTSTCLLLLLSILSPQCRRSSGRQAQWEWHLPRTTTQHPSWVRYTKCCRTWGVMETVSLLHRSAQRKRTCWILYTIASSPCPWMTLMGRRFRYCLPLGPHLHHTPCQSHRMRNRLFRRHHCARSLVHKVHHFQRHVLLNPHNYSPCHQHRDSHRCLHSPFRLLKLIPCQHRKPHSNLHQLQIC